MFSRMNNCSRRFYTKLSYLHNLGEEPLKYRTIGQILELTATKWGDRTAIISKSQNKSLNFQQVLIEADKLAASFKILGLKRGDRVGIWAPNLWEWYITHMAVARGGFVLVNLNPAYQADELENCLKSVQVKVLIAPHKLKNLNFYERILNFAPEINDKSNTNPRNLKISALPDLKTIITICDQTLNGTLNFEEVFNLASPNDIKLIKNTQNEIDPDSLAHLQFTSGTTGKPKSPMQSHFQIVNNSYFTGKRTELHRDYHKIAILAPFFHALGTIGAINSALNHGSTIVIPSERFDAQQALIAIRDEECSVIVGAPTMYVDLIKLQKTKKENLQAKIALTGGAICSPHLFNEMKEYLKVKKLKSVYGLTEVTAVAFQSLEQEDELQAACSVGYVQDHLQVKVIDEKGRIVPRGTAGELCIRGYSTTLGYWQDAKKTRELIGPDLWLKTGDKFILEPNGYGRIVGRYKEMIIRGGENIFPIEIENYLNTHPIILETYVIGLPHERLGEEVCACIRIKSGENLTLEEIKNYCKDKIAHYKVPTKLRIIDNFPKTASGKIQKFKLINMAN